MDEKTYRFLPAWDPVLRVLHWWNAATMTAMAAMGIVFMVCGSDLPEGTEDALRSIHASVGFLFGAGCWRASSGFSWARRPPLDGHAADFRSPQEGLCRYRPLLPQGLSRRDSLVPCAQLVCRAHIPGFFILAAVQVASGSSMLDCPKR
jgi:hypothetical protein